LIGAAVYGEPMEVRPDAPQDRGSTGARIEGVQLVRLHRYADHRGSLTPIMSDSSFWSEPVVHAYRITIRPGRIKGWGMHRLQADRYYIESGRVRVVLYDGRVASATHQEFDEFGFDETTPALVRIPPGVWHADQNTGETDAVILNFPTRAYDAEDPDKHRIDPHSGEIPFDWSLRDA
jgi:dTDP-4-dehydrorhamnose 3,5-epimerase